MKLATFRVGDGMPELGIVTSHDVICLSRIAPQHAGTMLELIVRWDEIEAQVRAIEVAGEVKLSLSQVTLMAPIQRPGKIMAIGLNYADHIEESGQAVPQFQVWFTKAVTSVTGPYDPIEIPKVSQLVDYEAEMVAIIGKGGKHIAKDDAARAVFGYCVGNDVTERAWQMRTQQWSLGKSFDTHAPFGPWITTADEVGDPHRFGIKAFVNDEVRQDSNTSHLVFNVWDQVSELSQAMTLEAGDVIFTGTPGGVGAAMRPMQFLKAGDVVKIEIDTLGSISNTCVPEA
jgi:ureidoglycolate lyase